MGATNYSDIYAKFMRLHRPHHHDRGVALFQAELSDDGFSTSIIVKLGWFVMGSEFNVQLNLKISVNLRNSRLLSYCAHVVARRKN